MLNNTIKISQTIYINKCQCGWRFPALDKRINQCPQCIPVKRFCIACENEILSKSDTNYCKTCRKKYRCFACGGESKTPFTKFCSSCGTISKNIVKKNYNHRKTAKKNFKEVETIDDICNLDCFNCQYSECLMPVDEDEETGKLF